MSVRMYVWMYLCMSALMYAAGPWRQRPLVVQKDNYVNQVEARWYRYVATGMTSFNASAMYVCLYACCACACAVEPWRPKAHGFMKELA